MAAPGNGGQQVNPAAHTPHKVIVKVGYGAKDNPTIETYEFHNVALKMQSPAGVNLVNQDGDTIAFFPFDVVVSVIAPELDRKASQLVLAENVISFPGITH